MKIERLKSLIKAKGITQKELATELKITESTISDWKKGRLRASVEDVENIATYFNISTDYLLGRDTAPHYAPKSEIEQLYDKLSDRDKQRTIGYIEGLLDENKTEVK